MKRLSQNNVLKLALVPLLAAAFGALVVFGIYFAMGEHNSPPRPNTIQHMSQPKPGEFIKDLPKTLRFESLTKIFPSI